MKSYIIITGAAGFIGSHLCDAFVKRNYHVIGIDDLSSGRISNIYHLLDQISFIEGSILDPSILDKACLVTPKPTAIFHLAAIPSVISSIELPEASHQVNVNGTFQVLMAAKKHNIRRVIYSASSSAYGESPEEFKSEEICPDLISPYGLQKWVGEKYCELFAKYYNVETISLRYFNVFGPRQDPNSLYAAVIPKFINSVINETPVTIHGDGLQSRDFTYIDNIIEGNLKSFFAPKDACGKVYNLAIGKSETLLSLLDTIERILGKKAKREFLPLRAGDIRDSKASIKLIEKMLNYEPIVNFYDGMKLTIDYFKKI